MAGKFIEIRYCYGKSLSTCGLDQQFQVRMIPSQVTAFIHQALGEIDALSDKIRYGSHFEVGDLLEVSSAYERLGKQLLDLGQIEDAFLQFAQAAECCCSATDHNWEYIAEYGYRLRSPLRGRFFAMYSQCKDLVRKYPRLRFNWEESGLTDSLGYVTEADQNFAEDRAYEKREFEKNWEFTQALRFGRNEVYRRRRG